jgi:radical SAM superfamily enzyme YgiQ (UPF0313 family)
VRRQSVEKVYGDVCAHLDRGFSFFFFYDDNFTTDRRWTRELLERLGPMNIRFNTQTRVDFHWTDGAARKHYDEAMLRAMHRAGGNVLYIGYETIEDDVANAWCKGYRGAHSLESRLREDTQILHDHGFWIHAMFVMGPQHTARTAGGIVRFARRCAIETMQISVLTPFPGTPLFEEMRPNLIFDDFPADWDYYDGTHCVYSTARMGIPGLQRAILDAHKRFYRRGGWYAHTMRALASRRMPLKDKLLDFWVGIRRSKNIFHKWRLETEAFLEEVRARMRLAGEQGGI